MKRMIALILVALTAVAVFAGCGSSENAASKTPGDAQNVQEQGKTVDLNAVMQAVNDAAGVTAEKLESANDLKRYYRIDPADVKQFAAQKDSDNHFVLVEATDAAAASRVQEALNKKLEDIIRDSTSYSPEKAEIVKKCTATIDGNYVSLIITDKADEALQAYKSKIQ